MCNEIKHALIEITSGIGEIRKYKEINKTVFSCPSMFLYHNLLYIDHQD